MRPSHPSVVKQRAAASKAKGRHPGTAACPGHSTPGGAAGDTGPRLPLGGKARIPPLTPYLVLGASVPGAPRALDRPPTSGGMAPRAEPAAQPGSSPRSDDS